LVLDDVRIGNKRSAARDELDDDVPIIDLLYLIWAG